MVVIDLNNEMSDSNVVALTLPLGTRPKNWLHTQSGKLGRVNQVLGCCLVLKSSSLVVKPIKRASIDPWGLHSDMVVR